MKTITLRIPESSSLDPKYAVRFLAAKLYESGKLSLGEAASLVNMSKVAFAETIGDYGVSLINYPVTDMVQDAKKF